MKKDILWGGGPKHDALENALREAFISGYLEAVNDSEVFDHLPTSSAKQAADLWLDRHHSEKATP